MHEWTELYAKATTYKLVLLSRCRDDKETDVQNSSTETKCNNKKKIYDLKLVKKFRDLLKAGRRPSDPRPDGPVTSPDFPQFFVQR